jgi:hypothetical protein
LKSIYARPKRLLNLLLIITNLIKIAQPWVKNKQFIFVFSALTNRYLLF